MIYRPYFTGTLEEVRPEHFNNAIKSKFGQRPDLNPHGERELEDGTWLTPTHDGNYYDERGGQWNELLLNEIDNDGESVQTVYSFGYVRLKR